MEKYFRIYDTGEEFGNWEGPDNPIEELSLTDMVEIFGDGWKRARRMMRWVCESQEHAGFLYWSEAVGH